MLDEITICVQINLLDVSVKMLASYDVHTAVVSSWTVYQKQSECIHFELIEIILANFCEQPAHEH